MFWVVEHVPPHPDITSLTAGGNYGSTALNVEVREREQDGNSRFSIATNFLSGSSGVFKSL